MGDDFKKKWQEIKQRLISGWSEEKRKRQGKHTSQGKDMMHSRRPAGQGKILLRKSDKNMSEDTLLFTVPRWGRKEGEKIKMNEWMGKPHKNENNRTIRASFPRGRIQEKINLKETGGKKKKKKPQGHKG